MQVPQVYATTWKGRSRSHSCRSCEVSTPTDDANVAKLPHEKELTAKWHGGFSNQVLDGMIQSMMEHMVEEVETNIEMLKTMTLYSAWRQTSARKGRSLVLGVCPRRDGRGENLCHMPIVPVVFGYVALCGSSSWN